VGLSLLAEYAVSSSLQLTSTYERLRYKRLPATVTFPHDTRYGNMRVMWTKGFKGTFVSIAL